MSTLRFRDLCRFAVLACVVACFAADAEDEVALGNQDRRIKGQQYVTQTVVAKVVGPSGFSEEFLELLRNDSNVPIVIDNSTFVDGANGTTTALVTENIKTTMTRITIPLNPSFTDSDWYRETLRKFLQKNRVALRNNTTEREYSENGTDVDLIMLKLWAAATLRDNIITVFGTVIYAAGDGLVGDMHSSLVHLYDLVRLRRVSTISFLDALENMSFESPHEQFKILFQKLEKHVPKYLRSCVTYWLECLHTNRVDVDDVLTDKDGVLVADFLSGIDSSALAAVKQKVLFPRKTAMGALPRNEDLLGAMLANVLSGIADGSLALTRQLFAGILLHLPLNKLAPHADECQRYFVDLAKGSDATEGEKFAKAVGKIDLRALADPYELVKSVFKSLLAEDPRNRDLYESILINVHESTNTYAVADYDVVSPIVSSATVDMAVLLGSIVPEEYPADIVDAKDRLLYYIDKSYIDLEFVLRGFVKYQEATPTELLVAALTRIELRSPDLSPELLSTVNSLKTHVVYKKALNNLRLTLSVADATTLLLSFQSPNLPQSLRDAAAELRVLLHDEFVHVDRQLNKQSTAACSRPRQCVIGILKQLMARGQIRNKECELKVKQLLRLVDQYGEPVASHRSFPGNCVDYSRIKSSRRSEEAVPENRTKEIYPGKYNPSPYKNRQSTAYSKPIFVSRLDSGRVIITGSGGEIFHASVGPELPDVTFDRVPVPHPGSINDGGDLLPKMEPTDGKYVEPIERLLRRRNLAEELGVAAADEPTKGTLLRDILRKALAKGPEVFDDPEQMTFAERYLKLLEYAYKVLPPPPPVTSKHQRREVNLPTLLRAVPVPADDESAAKFDILKAYLATADLSHLTDAMDAETYPSKGTFLKHLLRRLLDGNIESGLLLDSIRYFENRVMTSGYGAQPVDWIMVVEKMQLPASGV